MADDKKAKKKKAKKEKTEEEAPKEPAPPPPAPPADEAEGDWLSAATEPEPEAPPPAEEHEEQGHVDAESHDQEQFLGDPEGPPPQPPKKKPKFFIYWNRRKPKFYDYNYDYGSKYYSNLVDYIDHKNLGSRDGLPRRTAFAQRGIDISLCHKSRPDYVTENLMHNVRSSIRGYENFQRDYVYDADRAYFV